MMVENKISSAFKMLINRPLEGNAKLVQPIREISRLKYGKMKDIVEFEISRRSKLT
jgi:hypothetical protein